MFASILLHFIVAEQLPISRRRSAANTFMLNDENAPVPSVYNKENKMYGKETTYTIAPVILWDSSRVWKILTAYVYTGAMVLGKTKTLISGKCILKLRNNKEAIVMIIEGRNFEVTKTALSEDLKYIAGYNDLPYGEMENSTVLVTGATGLIGVSLVRALLEIGKIHVIAFVRNIEKAKKIYAATMNSNLEFIVGDITSKIQIDKRIDYNYDQIAMILTQKKRSTLRGRQEWNGMMVANIMKNERRWGDLEARKSIVVDYKLGKVTKNNGNRCSAYVPEHHQAIVSPEIARAAHLVASSNKKCGVQDIVVIQQGALKGFIGIHPNWSGINAESIRSLCLNAYLPEEVVELNDMTEMRSGKKSDMALLSDYLTVSGTCFINQSSPVMTVSKNGIRFSKACHTRLDDCEYVELLYHPILQVVILRKSNHDFSTAMHWRENNDVHSAFSARAFSGLVFQTLNWKRSCRYQCRGICRGRENAKFLIFELDESRILTGKNQYKQAENCAMNLKCRLYRSKWVQSITVSDVMESGQVVENPMIGAIPSRNEVQRELDDLLMSM